jgi:hypothetical protein
VTLPVIVSERHDRHRLPVGPLARESLAFMLDLPDERVAGFVYTWVNGEGRAGAALCAYGSGIGREPVFEAVDGTPVPDTQGFDDWRVGGCTVRHLPDEVAEVTFDGAAASLEYQFEGYHPAYAYSQHPNPCPAYVADDRIEQSGRVRGVLRVGDREFSFDTLAHRDHSWGTRDWGVAHHWKWIEAQAQPNVSVHAWQIQALGRTDLLGYVYKDGRMAHVTAVDVDFQLDERLFHTAIDVVFHDDAGRTTTLQGELTAMFEFKVSPLATLNEGSMRMRIDGRPGIGHVEMCWQKGYLAHMRGEEAT